MGNPSVSVIIPVYNRAGLLAEAVESVMKQTFRDYELIIADDCSDDSPEPAIEKLSRKYSVPVKWVRLQKHSGMPGLVRNRGAEKAAGSYIAFLDSDDLWVPEKLEVQSAVPACGRLPVLSHTREHWIRNGKPVSQASQKHIRSGMMFAAALRKCVIGPSTVMIEKKLFERYEGFREDIEVAEDYELWLRITSENPVEYIDRPLTVKRAGEWNQLSEKYGQIEIFRIKALKGLIDSDFFKGEKMYMAMKVLSEKSMIYSKGCAKRGRLDEAGYYRKLSEYLSSRQTFRA